MSVGGTLTKFALETLHDKYFKKKELSPLEHAHHLYDKLQKLNSSISNDFNIIGRWANCHPTLMLSVRSSEIKEWAEVLEIDASQHPKFTQMFEEHIGPLRFHFERKGFKEIGDDLPILLEDIRSSFNILSANLRRWVSAVKKKDDQMFLEALQRIRDCCEKLEESTESMKQIVESLVEFSKRLEK